MCVQTRPDSTVCGLNNSQLKASYVKSRLWLYWPLISLDAPLFVVSRRFEQLTQTPMITIKITKLTSGHSSTIFRVILWSFHPYVNQKITLYLQKVTIATTKMSWNIFSIRITFLYIFVLHKSGQFSTKQENISVRLYFLFRAPVGKRTDYVSLSALVDLHKSTYVTLRSKRKSGRSKVAGPNWPKIFLLN